MQSVINAIFQWVIVSIFFFLLVSDLLSLNTLTEVQQDGTIFNTVTYLGSAAINAPKSEAEIRRNMNILNAEQSLNLGIKISISVPSSSQGSVV